MSKSKGPQENPLDEVFQAFDKLSPDQLLVLSVWFQPKQARAAFLARLSPRKRERMKAAYKEALDVLHTYLPKKTPEIKAALSEAKKNSSSKQSSITQMLAYRMQ